MPSKIAKLVHTTKGLLLTLVGALVFATATRAEFITFEFGGVVTSTDGSTPGSIGSGSTFTGSMTFDPVAGTPKDFQFLVDGTYSFPIGGVGGFALFDEGVDFGGPPIDIFGFNIKTSDNYATGYSNYAPQEALLFLDSTNPDALSGSLSDLAVDFSKLDTNWLTVAGGLVDFFMDNGSPTLTDFWSITGHLTSLRLVGGPPPEVGGEEIETTSGPPSQQESPEPATLALAGLGALVLGLWHRRRSKLLPARD